MTEMNCFACDDLVELVPEIATEGVNETMCTSLQNNTGLNPSLTVLHNNCEDLSDANDCLVGRMNNEVENFKWQDFFHRFIPNVYEFNKMLICDSCGQWTKIGNLETAVDSLGDRVTDVENQLDDIQDDIDSVKDDLSDLNDQIADYDQRLDDLENDMDTLKDKVSGLCELVAQTANPVLDSYGTLTGSQYASQTARMGGEIVDSKLTKTPSPTSNGLWNMVGLRYSKKTLVACDGSTKTYEWIQPYIQDYTFASNIAYGDVIWRVPTSTCINQWGFTQHLITELTNWVQWWDGFGSSFGERKECSLRLSVVNGYLQMDMIGSLGNMADTVVTGGTIAPLVYVS